MLPGSASSRAASSPLQPSSGMVSAHVYLFQPLAAPPYVRTCRPTRLPSIYCVSPQFFLRLSQSAPLPLRCAGNAYNTPAYAVGVARATAIGGPYTKYAGNPILHSASASPAGLTFYGPGHCSVVLSQAGNWSMVYHAWCVSLWAALGAEQATRSGQLLCKLGRAAGAVGIAANEERQRACPDYVAVGSASACTCGI